MEGTKETLAIYAPFGSSALAGWIRMASPSVLILAGQAGQSV